MSIKTYTNREGNAYYFEEVYPNVLQLKGNLKYFRYGGKENQSSIDESDLGFIDPSGGPFISVGSVIENKIVTKIDATNDIILFTVKNN